MIPDLFSSLQIRWMDVVDIAILSIIIYRLILMLKGTRTVQIIIGFLIVSIVFLGAGYFHLAGVSWVLRNLFNSLVVVIIVLFQADFRNALARMGTQTLFFDYKKGKSSEFVEQLYKACSHMSKTGMGALVVLEREMGLRAYHKHATKINAEFSPQLLVTLFNAHAPLHDGAVIIDKNQMIAVAGSILPLSANLSLSDRMGTRHRAAIGLSEETDAIVLIVSEETGIVSFVWKGELHEEGESFSIKDKLIELLLVKS